MLSALVYQMERRKGLVTSGVHFMFWVISLAAGVFILSSKIMQLQRGVCTMLRIQNIFGVNLKQKYLWSNNVIRLLVHIKTCKTIRFGWRLSARWTISWRLSSTHFFVYLCSVSYMPYLDILQCNVSYVFPGFRRYVANSCILHQIWIRCTAILAVLFC